VDYGIAVAIVSKPRLNWPQSLPFFVQSNLMQNSKLSQGTEFNVTLQQVAEP